jgi:quinone-modifying oxidoreductase, subunit QmoB
MVECPFCAIDEVGQGRTTINLARYRRCGTCTDACPFRCVRFGNHNSRMVDELNETNKIPGEFTIRPGFRVLARENDAYPSIAAAATNRSQRSRCLRNVPARCLGSAAPQWISAGVRKGYDQVMQTGGRSGDDNRRHFVTGSGLAKNRPHGSTAATSWGSPCSAISSADAPG